MSSELKPERRADKNGRVTTRWVKPATPDRAVPTTIPSLQQEALPEALIKQQRVAKLIEITQYSGNKANLPRWVDLFVSDEQIAAIDSAIAVLEDASTTPEVVREQKVVSCIFNNFLQRSEEQDLAALDAFQTRSAFCSQWSVENAPHPRNRDIIAYSYGMRNTLKSASWTVPRGDDDIARQTSCLRFAYELRSRFDDEAIVPVKNRGYGFSGSIKETHVYKEIKLAEFIYENHVHVDELIDLAVKHRTTDVEILRALLENENGAKSLARGWL